MNDSTSNCSFISDSLLDFTRNFRFFVYQILIVPYFFVSIFGYCALLVAFYRESKKESAYRYQVFFTINKVLEISFTVLLLVGFEVLSGRDEDEGQLSGIVGAFQRCYACQFFIARVVIPMSAVFMLNSLFLTLAMTFDRLIALWRPFMYQTMNHKRHQLIALTICSSLSVLTNFLAAFGLDIRAEFDRNTSEVYYKPVWTTADSFFYSPVGRFFDHFRSIVRIGSVLVLIASSLGLAFAFRVQTRKASKSLRQEEQLRRFAVERSLLILCVCQSCFSLLRQFALVSLNFALPVLGACWDSILAPFVDAALQLAETSDFLVVIAVNANMRRAFLKVVPLDKLWQRLKEASKKWSTHVAPMQS